MGHTASPDRYDAMKYARCGRSGLMLPRISLGLWHNFGDVGRYVVLRAFDLGITHFDLGNNTVRRPARRRSTLAACFARISRAIAMRSSFQPRPATSFFYSHRPDPNTPLEETMGALDQAVRSGKALYAGISNYQPAETRKAAALLRGLGTPCLIHQPSYSMLNRWIEDGLTAVLEDEGIGCIVFSPLARDNSQAAILGKSRPTHAQREMASSRPTKSAAISRKSRHSMKSLKGAGSPSHNWPSPGSCASPS
jgi:L-glyceraldehyde 3-phosphate reductase